MSFWQVFIVWLTHAAGLATLPIGGEAESPPFWTTYGDGRTFVNSIRSRRVS